MMPRIVAALLGIWLMAAPDVLGYGGAARITDHILGAAIAASAIVATSEVTRPVRWIGIPLGAWLLIAPWALGYAATVTTLDSTVIGILLIGLSCIRGPVRSRFGGGWSSLWRPPVHTANRSRNGHPEHGS